MAKEETLRVNILADKKRLEEGLSGAEKGINKFASSAKKIFLGLGAALGVREIIRFGNEATKAADAQIQAQQSLLVALNNNVSAQRRLIKQSGELQKVTMFGDEATIEAQRQLAVLGLTEDQIKKLIPLVQDMATGLRIDLVSAASLVGKSVSSSTDALARYFKSGLDGVIGQSQRAAVLTETLTKKFEGQAEAAAKVGRGPLVQLKNAWGDYMEVIGGKILPVLSKFANFGTTILQSLSKQSTALIQEKVALNSLINSITSANVTQDLRNTLIKRLQQEYPDFLGNLNAEKVTNQQLADRLNDVNKEYGNKIKLTVQQELINKQAKQIADSLEKEIRLREKLFSAEQRLQRTQELIAKTPVSDEAMLRTQQFEINQVDRLNKGIQDQQEFRSRLNEQNQKAIELLDEMAGKTPEVIEADKKRDDGYVKIIKTINDYKNELSDLDTQIQNTDASDLATITTLEKKKTAIENLLREIEKRTKLQEIKPIEVENILPDLEASESSSFDDLVKMWDDLTAAEIRNAGEIEILPDDYLTATNAIAQMTKDVNAIMKSGFADAVTGIAESFGNLLTGTGDFAQNMNQMIADLAKNIGRAFIGIGMGYMAIPGMQGKGAELIAAGTALTMMGQIGSNLIAQDKEAYQQKVSAGQQTGTTELTVAKIDNRYIYLSNQRGARQMEQIT